MGKADLKYGDSMVLYNMLLQHDCTLILQDDKKQAEVREDEGMGKADLKYGDSMVLYNMLLQHDCTLIL